MNSAPYDARAIANLILDEAQQADKGITNLALQKLLYFAHGIFLIERQSPLITGYFEAWRFGPVHPTVYQAFKRSGERPIKFRATREDILTGAHSELPSPSESRIVQHIKKIVSFYGRLTPGRLVDISHARESPWHFVVSSGSKSMVLGLRITDDLIVERFKFHKVLVRDVPLLGEPLEDSPFA